MLRLGNEEHSYPYYFSTFTFLKLYSKSGLNGAQYKDVK